MHQKADWVCETSLRRLHKTEIKSRERIRSFLELIRERRTTLKGSLNRQVRPETAQVRAVYDDTIELELRNPANLDREQLILNAELDGSPYFFVVSVLDSCTSGAVKAKWPVVIYRTERRDRDRQPWSSKGWRAVVVAGGEEIEDTTVEDFSGDGARLRISVPSRRQISDTVRVRLEEPDGEVHELFGVVRHRENLGLSQQRLGLTLTEAVPGLAVPVKPMEQVLPLNPRRRAAGFALAGGRHLAGRWLAWAGISRPRISKIEVLDYSNERAEPMRAIVDRWGDPLGATAVVIPPAFGKTKETLLPLAATIVSTFRRARRPVTVVRFDATRRRGESYIEPECRSPGNEFLRWSLSQSARDTLATAETLRQHPRLRPKKTILVAFSAASVDSRRALASDCAGLFDGWVSVVGASDLQSALRTVSGGIDFVRAADHGVRFGRYEVQGILVDADYTVGEAVSERMAFLEDSRREMAQIRIPITWIHGKYDAWMDLERARDVLSFGNQGNRQIVEIPTGHQLQGSHEAFDAFQLIATEVARMALGFELPPALPNFLQVDRKRAAERARLPSRSFEPRRFWRDYLVGRNGHLGSELMTATEAYRVLMAKQAKSLKISPGQRVADVGCGTGAFLRSLGQDGVPASIQVDGFDFVRGALTRARDRAPSHRLAHRAKFSWVEADLAKALPVRSSAYDAALVSLVLSYVSDPERFLADVARILKPLGRLVVSSLRPDADTSRIYLTGLAELRAGGASAELGGSAASKIDESARSFLNDAARLLTLEEEGQFRFWDAEDLKYLAKRAGFKNARATRAFGDPPQAIVLSADKA